ncbi:2-dehydropantoate 2-reductase [Rhodocyclus tenuis]|uniref:2-dehydropantoate 2-reductase n=2 Tax=Rhodocyclus TaxID=1064 RepID=A0A6L5JYI2_RHOTE|nr:2-dehydropantoate 2-reductase [Rhodocyclus gracilis]MQY52383.1 2-dehydropantoate 2-reductase [Rhodocyclus gracilis]NJA88290.1 2-dehydropantoate 2-reductase [Rhodocyclus gracilis]
MVSPRIAIFGAGAIGVYLASRLHLSGQAVTLVTRPGSSLPPVIDFEEGACLRKISVDFQVPADAPYKHDFVIVTTKAQDLPVALPLIRPWLDADGHLVIAQNGLPWWFLDHLEEGTVLRAVDPDGSLLREINLARTLSCVVFKSVERLAGGHIRALVTDGDRFVLGCPAIAHSPAAAQLADILAQAGLQAETAEDITVPLWEKLLGNVVLNPLSAISGLDIGNLLADHDHRARLVAGIEEARAVARAWGLPPGSTPDQRLLRTAKVAASGTFRTSMLQDREAGRTLELEPILGSVRELARRRGVPTPTLDSFHAAARHLSI